MLYVLILSGHGSDTPGKCSPKKEDGTRFYEWKWCKEMGMKLHEALKIRKDIEPIIVNPEYNDISLGTRARRVNNYAKALGPKNCILIEIHCNAAGSEDKWMSARGWSVWTTKGTTISDKLADCLYKAADKVFGQCSIMTDSFKGQKQKLIRKDFSDGDADYESNFYVIKQAACAAVLIENFFQDNKQDVEILENEYCQEKILECYLTGIDEYKTMRKL